MAWAISCFKIVGIPVMMPSACKLICNQRLLLKPGSCINCFKTAREFSALHNDANRPEEITNDDFNQSSMRNKTSENVEEVSPVFDSFPVKFDLDDKSIDKFCTFDKSLEMELKDNYSINFPIHSKSFADFANSSKTLQTLLLFGVKLYVVEEKYPESLQFLVKLNINEDIMPKLQYLKSIGITPHEFGNVLTKNIMILDPKYKVEDFEECTNYLRSKKFSKDHIASIVSRFPLIFNYSVAKLDGILGFYQKVPTNYESRPMEFSGNDVRSFITKCPQLIGASLQDVYLRIKFLEVTCGFTISQIRQFIIFRPAILLKDSNRIEVLHRLYVREMGLTNEQLAHNPFVFDIRPKLMEWRHYYLKYLGRNKYKEDQPGYLSLYDIICTTNDEFCNKCRLGPYSNFMKFLKTI